MIKQASAYMKGQLINMQVISYARRIISGPAQKTKPAMGSITPNTRM